MMPLLNLLDWRAAARAQHRQALRRQLQLSVLLALLLGLLGHAVLHGMLERQQQTQTQARDDLRRAGLALQAQRQIAEQARHWQQALRQIETLQQERLALGHWLDALSEPLPEALRWLRLSQDGTRITLQARSDNSAALGEYLQALQDSPWFARVQLQSQQAERFTVQLQLRQPDTAKEAS